MRQILKNIWIRHGCYHIIYFLLRVLGIAFQLSICEKKKKVQIFATNIEKYLDLSWSHGCSHLIYFQVRVLGIAFQLSICEKKKSKIFRSIMDASTSFIFLLRVLGIALQLSIREKNAPDFCHNY